MAGGGRRGWVRRASGDECAARPIGGPREGSEARQRAVARIRDLEQRIELGQFEWRLEVVVQIGQPKLTPLLPDLLRERYEDAEARAVDVTGLREVDQELLLSTLQLVQHLLLQLLSIADDELPLNIHHDDLSFLLDRKAHVPVSWRIPFSAVGAGSAACRAVMAATLKMSSAEAPRERSLQGRCIPWRMGPIARANASRCTNL